jgi:hypothetical protein
VFFLFFYLYGTVPRDKGVRRVAVGGCVHVDTVTSVRTKYGETKVPPTANRVRTCKVYERHSPWLAKTEIRKSMVLLDRNKLDSFFVCSYFTNSGGDQKHGVFLRPNHH